MGAGTNPPAAAQRFDPDKLQFVKLAPVYFPAIRDFDCADADLNEFLKQDAYSSQQAGLAITTLVLYEGRLAGFFALCNDSIRLSAKEIKDFCAANKDILAPPPEYPGIKVARLGINNPEKNKGIATYLIKWIRGLALELQNQVGCRFLTVDAYPKSVPFYTKRRFKPNEHERYRKLQPQSNDNLSMRLDTFNPPAGEDAKLSSFVGIKAPKKP